MCINADLQNRRRVKAGGCGYCMNQVGTIMKVHGIVVIVAWACDC